ncbi:GDYXXLXY domain-containing protein [Diaphorobacter caeni]|uniref:GDYXXLXY domain-containing protein n=1 Tax=Diaphorobacter caeni TaxID=2784387 RepID=UPI00188E04E9|nr:GDYXXLXY domain-containing protein [Diaphorobacter caeni]MBF5007775.1 GDYXXLXY domain-containing protein [Diaphorobacter caeni]
MSFFSSQPSWWPRARQLGLVSGDSPEASADEEPSIFVIVLALIGAVVCAIAAGVFLVALVDSDFWFRHPASYVLSLIGIVGSGWLLSRHRSVFVTCLALVMWGLFCSLLMIRLANDLHGGAREVVIVMGLLALLQLVGASLARAQWIRRIMGVVFAIALYLCLTRLLGDVALLHLMHVQGVVLAAAWLLWLRKEPEWLQRQAAQPAWMGWAAFADSAAVGLLLMVVLGVGGSGWGDGMTYWFFGLRGPRALDADSARLLILVGRTWAALLVAVAVGGLCAHWKKHGMATRPTLQTVLGVGVLLAVAAWFSPSLGVIALLAAGALIGARWRIAVLCGLGALWALSQFYYSLAWPLAQKGLGLAAMGAVLLAGLMLPGLLAGRGAASADGDHAADGLMPVAAWSRARLVCLVAGALLVFGLVNWDVRGKEQVIAHGQPVLVKLVPVDPRSLMQGDYMALRFDLPANVHEGLEKTLLPTARVRATLDDKGRATVKGLVAERFDPVAGEVVLPLKRLKGRWVLVTDAYFFPEGTGKVFERAQYGDFRVLPDGRALLVGLADADGKPIAVPRALSPKPSSDVEGGDIDSAADAEVVAPAEEPLPQASRP